MLAQPTRVIPPNQSGVEDVSDTSSQTESDPDLDAELESEITADQQEFYKRQQQQAMYYQQHQQQHGSSTDVSTSANGYAGAAQHGEPSRTSAAVGHGAQGIDDDDDEEMYSDDESSTGSIPPEDIDFSLTYALHTFLATVEGQASVVKGDSLLLLDDANSYWWLVRVLKTEDVGYIPAENIETPYERLARLNKHRNVDLAAATQQEKQAGAVQGRDRLKGMIAGKAKGFRADRAGEPKEGGSRRVDFAPPTYVDHPGVTWSSDEESDGEGEYAHDVEEVEGDESMEERRDERVEGRYEGDDVDEHLRQRDMEPDDGIEWDSTAEEQRRAGGVVAKSNNPFAQQNRGDGSQLSHSVSDTSLASSNGSSGLDPAQAGDTRRITATPSVAQSQGGQGPLLPSAMQSMQSQNNGNGGARNVSGQSVGSVTSFVSTGSSSSAGHTGSPGEEGGKKMKKMKKASKEDLGEGEKRRSRGVLSGLFSRNKDKNKKGISSSDPRTSEDSTASIIVDGSPSAPVRTSEDATGGTRRAPTPGEPPRPGPTGHSFRVQQQDQALQQAYMNKYLTKSNSGDVKAPSAAETAAAMAQSAAAMKLAAMAGADASGKAKRPASIILSPNPAGPPLLNVIRVFAGDHIKSDSTFKTVLLNETTSSTDLIRQLMQRFHLHSSAGAAGYYLTIKDLSGEEMELAPHEKPLSAFTEAVERWTPEEESNDLVRALTPTIKRSSISSISSVASLSSHPAIAKLGMNDFSDDSAVKIYLHRRRPGSVQLNQGMPEPGSEFSSYSTQLSAVQESSPERDGDRADANEATPPGGKGAQPRYNPSLTIATNGQASPERYSSPSARFTVQLLIHPADLPDGSVFDPTSDAIVSRQVGRDRQPNGSVPMDSRKKLFILPRNATVVEVIEQGLERFGIQEGMVDGGDDVEDKAHRRSLTRVKYSLAVVVGGQERSLAPASKVLDAYPTPPQLRPAERTTPEQRRRSRDLTQLAGSLGDILPTDPIFVLRKVQQKPIANGPLQRQQASSGQPSGHADPGRGAMSPQEIIAAQRAASRANQKALISAHANTTRGVDVVLPDRGTLRSSMLFEGNDEVMRYSYIDGDGETYDISELLEEEWGADGSKASPNPISAPALLRTQTDSSNYVTAPSTPEPGAQRQLGDNASKDILKGVLQRANGNDGKLEEKLHRVINKVKTTAPRTTDAAPSLNAATPSGRTTPQGRVLGTLPEGRAVDVDSTPRASESRSNSRQANYHQTAASVNRIVSRHRQQPSIASIMSDFSSSPAPESREPHSGSGEDERGTGASTPMTATSSTHPTPPFGSTGVFTRSISSISNIPARPTAYTDDFGIKSLMAIIDVRSRNLAPKRQKRAEVDVVEKRYWGERIDWEGVHPEIKGCFAGTKERLDRFDRDIDELLASALRVK